MVPPHGLPLFLDHVLPQDEIRDELLLYAVVTGRYISIYQLSVLGEVENVAHAIK